MSGNSSCPAVHNLVAVAAVETVVLAAAAIILVWRHVFAHKRRPYFIGYSMLLADERGAAMHCFRDDDGESNA